jgi:predicted ATP-dependent endonuclease of OLD family
VAATCVLETLSRFDRHQYFLTTHSNHFLDLTLDVEDFSVFTVHKQLEQADVPERPARFTIKSVSRQDRSPLELLGVRNSSVLLSNCTIWVEGITDRRYVSHWLMKYDELLRRTDPTIAEYREDLHYSFVEYGGGNITHFSFLDDDEDGDAEKRIQVDQLCGRLFLITDNDCPKPGGAKDNRRQTLERRLQERYFCLEGREIENLISPVVLLRVLAEYGEVFQDAPTLKQSEYRKEPMGTFIENFLQRIGGRKRRGSYADGKTVATKVDFCAKVIRATSAWEELSGDAQELTRKVYGFIAGANRK